MSSLDVVILEAHISKEIEKDAVDLALQAFEKNIDEMEAAMFIKKELDKKYNPTWNCIVGCEFGCFVTAEVGYFIYFKIEKFGFVVFKSPS